MRSMSDNKELEEERRLAYVGITRARERLYISRALSRSAWGAPSYNPPSRFLDELPDELVDWRREAAPGPAYAAPSMARLAARPGVRSPGNRPIITLEPGDRVTHDTFGLGTVIATGGFADSAEATVDFGDDAKPRRFLLRYAPLEKL
jgi:DNA helicase-2/ATP-dependent DNA helicase PcrA